MSTKKEVIVNEEVINEDAVVTVAEKPKFTDRIKNGVSKIGDVKVKDIVKPLVIVVGAAAVGTVMAIKASKSGDDETYIDLDDEDYSEESISDSPTE